jgi:hypothetical protein
METGMQAILTKLEKDGLFRGRPVLRRKAWSHCRFSCGLLYRDKGLLFTAARRFLRSFTAWPFPNLAGPERSTPRARALLHTLGVMLRLRKPQESTA